MPDPLDLNVLSRLARCTCIPLRANTHEPQCPLIVIPRCLAVIEALREAVESIPSVSHLGMCQFRPAHSRLGSRACTCYIGKVLAALALVTRGRKQ